MEIWSEHWIGKKEVRSFHCFFLITELLSVRTLASENVFFGFDPRLPTKEPSACRMDSTRKGYGFRL